MNIVKGPYVWCDGCGCNNKNCEYGVSYEIDLGGYTKTFTLCYGCIKEAIEAVRHKVLADLPDDKFLT